MADVSRREAFSSLASRFKKTKDDKPLHVRPPYNEDEHLFQICLECEGKSCISVCEEDIIKLDGDKIPFLSFENSGCTFCEECANVCPNEVLVLNQEHWIRARFNIDINSCLAWNNVMCSSCADACDESAINFLGVFRPTINMEVCTGCGFCYGVCPPYAVKYNALRSNL